MSQNRTHPSNNKQKENFLKQINETIFNLGMLSNAEVARDGVYVPSELDAIIIQEMIVKKIKDIIKENSQDNDSEKLNLKIDNIHDMLDYLKKQNPVLQNIIHNMMQPRIKKLLLEFHDPLFDDVFYNPKVANLHKIPDLNHVLHELQNGYDMGREIKNFRQYYHTYVLNELHAIYLDAKLHGGVNANTAKKIITYALITNNFKELDPDLLRKAVKSVVPENTKIPALCAIRDYISVILALLTKNYSEQLFCALTRGEKNWQLSGPQWNLSGMIIYLSGGMTKTDWEKFIVGYERFRQQCNLPLKNIDLSYSVLEDLVFPSDVFYNSEFTEITINRCVFENLIFASRFFDSKITNSTVNIGPNCEFINVDFTGSQMTWIEQHLKEQDDKKLNCFSIKLQQFKTRMAVFTDGKMELNPPQTDYSVKDMNVSAIFRTLSFMFESQNTDANAAELSDRAQIKNLLFTFIRSIMENEHYDHLPADKVWEKLISKMNKEYEAEYTAAIKEERRKLMARENQKKNTEPPKKSSGSAKGFFQTLFSSSSASTAPTPPPKPKQLSNPKKIQEIQEKINKFQGILARPDMLKFCEDIKTLGKCVKEEPTVTEANKMKH